MPNDEYVHGFQYEASWAAAYTPNAAHQFYLLGPPVNKRFNPHWPEQSIIETYNAAQSYPDVEGGLLISKGDPTGYVVNGIPDYIAKGACATTTNVHKITPVAMGSNLLSTRWHYEEKGGTEDLYRDVLGSMVDSIVYSWNILDPELRFQMFTVAGLERNNEDGSSPAVELTNAPTLPTSSNAEPFDFAGSNCFSRWDVDGTPVSFNLQRFDLWWFNRLKAPEYSFYNGNWPAAIRKRLPGRGTLSVITLMDKRWSHNAIVGQLAKTMDFKFVAPSDPTNKYLIFELQNCVVSSIGMFHALGDDEELCMMKIDIAYGLPETYCKDGITDNASFYGE